MKGSRRVLITGGAGYVGGLLGARLAREGDVVGTDLRPRADLAYEVIAMDVRDVALGALLRARRITHVVHLASIVESTRDRARDFDVDVNGTRNVLACCVAAGVRHLTVSSSGAVYGYRADLPEWIDESEPLRASESFAYAHHKRLIEEMLAGHRTSHPSLGQLVLQIGTVLGRTTRNQITALFERPRILAVRGSESAFVFIWDEDLVGAIAHGVLGDRTGIFNVAGDGSMTIREIATLIGKRVLTVPTWALVGALATGRALGVSRYGPEQVDFLRYRPVLSNRRLKEEFGFRPAKTSAEAFQVFAEAARLLGAR